VAIAQISLDGDVPEKILGYGIPGLTFLLAVLAFWLLTAVQKKNSTVKTNFTAIYVFEGFVTVLAIIGLLSQIFRSTYDQKAAELQSKLDAASNDLKSKQSEITALTSKASAYDSLQQQAAESEAKNKSLTEENQRLKEKKQSWLKITSLYGLGNLPVRIFVIINGASYSYPTDNVFLEISDGQEVPSTWFAIPESDRSLITFFLIEGDLPAQRLTSSHVDEHPIAWIGKDSYEVYEQITSRSAHVVQRTVGKGKRVIIDYEIERH
jgi:hypothetical protein